MQNQTLEKFIKDTTEQIQLGETEDALKLLQNYLTSSSDKLKNEVVLYISRYNRLHREYNSGLIDIGSYRVEITRLQNGILGFLRQLPRHIKASAYPSPTVVETSARFHEMFDAGFEKILGINNLKQMSWLKRAEIVSRSVCRILTPSGFGTGFLISANRIMTNNHVIPTPDIGDQSYAEFNYEQDTSGKYLPSVRYKLSSTVFHTSPKSELDYTIIGIEPEQEKPPLTEWGWLELNPNADPTANERVIIVQHPNGGLKQISMNANQIIGSEEQFIFYSTDTMPGSSGSPVFNDIWQVVAIHHAYGGIKQDSEGKNCYANEGILMSFIRPHADKYWPTT